LSPVLPQILFRFMKPYALGFLDEKRFNEKQRSLLEKKFRQLCKTTVGKRIGITESSTIEQLPLTSYSLYEKCFKNPTQGDLLYPIEDYVKVMTSGTLSKPKTFLTPRIFLEDCNRKSSFSTLLLSTHDGEKITFKVGDVVYTNIASAPYVSGHILKTYKSKSSGWVKILPEDANMAFHEKVEYFIEHHKEIDIAFMQVTTLLDEIYQRIGEPFHLKGFITSDRTAGVFKEKIKKITGSYPKVNYGSTETGMCTVPSIEYPGSFILDWRVVYFEFLSEKNAVVFNEPKTKAPTETIQLEEVETKKRYQPVITPFKNELTRYVMPDIFECVSKGDAILGTELPVFKFYARVDRIISLHNFTRIAEEEILHILKKANIPFIDFTARVEFGGAKQYLAIYLEPAIKLKEEEVKERLHEQFMHFDKDYRALTKLFKYKPLIVHLLPKGTFKRYLRRKKGAPRIERIGMSEQNLKELIK